MQLVGRGPTKRAPAEAAQMSRHGTPFQPNSVNKEQRSLAKKVFDLRDIRDEPGRKNVRFTEHYLSEKEN